MGTIHSLATQVRNSGKGWWQSTVLQGLQAAKKLASGNHWPVWERGIPEVRTQSDTLQGKAMSPAVSKTPARAVPEPRAIPGCQICRPGCSGVPAPSEQARARSPSLPGHRGPSRLSSAPVAWQLCVWDRDSTGVSAQWPCPPSLQVPTSSAHLSRSSGVLFGSFIASCRQRKADLLSFAPRPRMPCIGARADLIAPMLLQTSFR